MQRKVRESSEGCQGYQTLGLTSWEVNGLFCRGLGNVRGSLGKLWIALKNDTERSSGQSLGKFPEGLPWESLTPSQGHAKIVSKIRFGYDDFCDEQ